ncbi:MAG TPA: CBS domain-containing protein [Chloroflexota bacterium]|nr:CBS domain-containing protein [Chloroflexota bacterium]
MSSHVEVIRPETTLEDAAKKMKDVDAGSMPVCDGDRLVGMVTDRDITVRATAQGVDPKSMTVKEVMSPDVVYGFEEQDVADAARIMEDKQIRRLLVLNRQKRLVGIVSLGDLATRASSAAITEEVVERVSEPTERAR